MKKPVSVSSRKNLVECKALNSNHYRCPRICHALKKQLTMLMIISVEDTEKNLERSRSYISLFRLVQIDYMSMSSVASLGLNYRVSQVTGTDLFLPFLDCPIALCVD